MSTFETSQPAAIQENAWALLPDFWFAHQL